MFKLFRNEKDRDVLRIMAAWERARNCGIGYFEEEWLTDLRIKLTDATLETGEVACLDCGAKLSGMIGRTFNKEKLDLHRQMHFVASYELNQSKSN